VTALLGADRAAFNRGHFWRGFREAMALPALVVAAALTGVGSLAQAAGHPIGAAMASTVLVWAGPSQVIFYGGLASGMALPALAFVVSLSAVRFLPMTMAMLPLVRHKGQSFWLQLLMAHFISVTVWAESLRRLPLLPQDERVPYYFGFAVACVGASTATTALGYILAGVLPTPFAAALLFLTPCFFTCSISAGARDRADWMAILLGFALEPLAFALAGSELDLFVVGTIGGTTAFLVDRLGKQVA
jgi:predicted branched-subunit amino acid permease